MSASDRWRLWAQRCADVRTLANSLPLNGRPAEEQLRVLRDKLPSLLDALVEEMRLLEHRSALLERMLDEQTARREELLRHVPVACVLTDVRGQITDANREAGQLLNSSVRSLLARPVELYVVNRADVERATARLEETSGRVQLQVVVKPREKPPVRAFVTIQRATGTPEALWRWFFLPQRTATQN